MRDTSLIHRFPLTSIFARLAGLLKAGFPSAVHIFLSSIQPMVVFSKIFPHRFHGRLCFRFLLQKLSTSDACVQKVNVSNACLSETPKNTTGLHMLVLDPKPSNIACDEPCARLSKNNHSTCYVSGFPDKTSTTAHLHFSSLLLSLQQCELKIPKHP